MSSGSFGHSPRYGKSLENAIFSHNTPSPTASHSTLLSSSSSSSKALPVLLRSFPLASGVTSSLPQFDRFSEARISPDRELIAFRTIENDVLLFSIPHSILLPAFQITNIDHYAWIGPIPFSSSSPSSKPSNGFVALVTLDHNGSISIYPFDRILLKNWLATVSPSNFFSPTSPIQPRRFTVDYTNQPRSLILDSEDSFPHSNPNLKSGGYITHTVGIDSLLEALTIKPSRKILLFSI
jgi:hypothetical protein